MFLDLGTTVDRPAGWDFALHELITPQIDHFEESRFWRDLILQFRMVDGVGPYMPFKSRNEDTICV